MDSQLQPERTSFEARPAVQLLAWYYTPSGDQGYRAVDVIPDEIQKIMKKQFFTFWLIFKIFMPCNKQVHEILKNHDSRPTTFVRSAFDEAVRPVIIPPARAIHSAALYPNDG
jgi:hypothetical protein